MRGMSANFIAEISRALFRQYTSLRFSLHALRPLAISAQYNHKRAPSLGLVSGFLSPAGAVRPAVSVFR
jgi:hypothetical protein